jgi:hypothetical protein
MESIEDNGERKHRVILDSLHYVREGKAADAFEMLDNALQEAARG